MFFLNRPTASVLAIAVASVFSTPVDAAEPRYTFAIPAQDLAQALQE